MSIVFWSIALSLHTIIRYYGVYEEPGVTTTFDFEFSISNYLKYGFITGLIFGFFYGVVSIWVEKVLADRFSAGLTVILESVLYTLVFALAWTISLKLWDWENGTSFFSENLWWLKNKFYFANVVYAVFISLGLSFIRIGIEKFGKGVFLKILLGKYRKPREENRIFMFLDLRSSTTIAEKLGHHKYSELIQDCFFDLNSVVPRHDAEIYQYVGDEAVLCWDYDKGINENNCVSLYFDFLNKLESKRDYYERKYGLLPSFKAGLHGGKLIVAEVGTIKKEIAYHGDTINTAARIQGQCNNLNAQLLISESLVDQLEIGSVVRKELKGEVLMRGKKNELKLYALDQVQPER